MSSEWLLEAEGLVKAFGGMRVVDDVAISCRAGEVVGLLGANGAGKTTSLRMCSGFLSCDAGSVRIGGHDLAAAPDQARRLLGVCTQDDTADGDFSVRGNLEQSARYFRPRVDGVHAVITRLLDRFGLTRFAHASPETLSGGYRRRLLIARALVHQPRLVFLDEPTTGLDPQARVAVWELISALRDEGLGIVLTTHYMDEAERLSDRLLVLEHGRVLAGGPSQQVLGDILGEHVVVISTSTSGVEAMLAWSQARGGVEPARVLDDWHIPLDGPGLAAFSARFTDAGFEVRKPTLDDLFLALSSRSASPACD